MLFSIEIDKDETTSVEFKRNCFTGRTTVCINGNEKTLKSPYRLSTHFDFEFTKRWEFFIERPASSKIVIEQIRPTFFGGFQPHKYKVYVDDLLVLEKSGY